MRYNIYDHIYVILCPGRDTRAWYMYSVEFVKIRQLVSHWGTCWAGA
jgi:hypothetical protein